MNRCALCIKMLHILYGNKQPISKTELATLLETNPRNISEFKNELITAGYMIEVVPGRFGGYLLKEDNIFPSLTLDTNEKEAINEALTYLNAQRNFIYNKSFNSAMSKLKAKIKDHSKSKETIYFSESKKTLSNSENIMVDLIIKAKDSKNTLCFYYLSSNNSDWNKRIVHPYEMIVTSDGFYMLAYDVSENKTREFKFFKIIDERMKEVQMNPNKFQRDLTFKINDHMGKNSLMKELIEVELAITGINARLINEREIENIIEKKYENDYLYIKFMMAGTLRLKSFILSLGSDCKVISPHYIKEEIYHEVQATINLYK